MWNIFFFIHRIQRIDNDGECYDILLDHENICLNWQLSAFCTFSTFKMLMKYNVEQFKVTKYVMSHTIIIYQF